MSSPTLIFYPGTVHSVVAPISDGLNSLSTVHVFQWEVSDRISSSKAFSWKIVSYQISATKASSFNVKTRIHKTGSFVAVGVCHPVSWPISAKYFVPSVAFNIDRRFSATSKYSWDVSQRRSSKKTSYFNALTSEYAHLAANFNVLVRIKKPGVTSSEWFNQVAQPVVHPISQQTAQPSSYFEWNAEKRINSSKTIRFNSRLSLKTQQSFKFNDNATLVVCQKAASWNLLSRIKPSSAYSWKLNQRFYKRNSITWNLRKSVVVQKSSHFRMTDKVTNSVSSSWQLNKRFFRQQSSRFNTYSKVSNWRAARFNTLFKTVVRDWQLIPDSPSFITTGVVHPISYKVPSGQPMPNKGLCKPIVQPVSYQYYAGYGAIPQAGIQFRVGINPNGRVQCTKQIAFNDLGFVKNTVKSQWNTVRRYSFTVLSQYNIYIPVSNQMSSSWITGAWTASHIRQTAQRRTDFSY